MTFSPVEEIEVDPARGQVYEEGWQSWSPTTWYNVQDTSYRPESGWRHLMRFRPERQYPRSGFAAEGLLVVDPGNGSAVRLYGAPRTDVDVPSIRAELIGDRLMVSADGPVRKWTAGSGSEALAQFGDEFAANAGVRTLQDAPRVWCSWYQYFEEVTEADIMENLADLDRHCLPVDVVQLDDGWSAAPGDWSPRPDRFPSLTDLADRIAQTGRRAGIWLAPFLAGSRSTLAAQHPDWLLDTAGINWNQDLHGLDLTHPGVRAYLWDIFRGLHEAGFDYFKLDFLYTGAVPGHRYQEMTGVQAYRSGLQLIRDAVGPSSFILGCGAPILPSVGLIDGMRVSPDTFHENTSIGSQLRGEMAARARVWQHGRFWINDADCFVGRPEFALREPWAAVIEQFGGLRSFSDRISNLDAWGLETARNLLNDSPPATPFLQSR